MVPLLKIPGKMLGIGKTAEPRDLLDLQGFIGQQGSGLLHARLQKLRFGRGFKKQFIVMVKLAFSHIAFQTETADGPVLLTGSKHLQAQILKGVEQRKLRKVFKGGLDQGTG